MNTPPLYGPSATRALTFMPSTSPYHRAEASGSATYSTTCATRLTLGMSMMLCLAGGRRCRQPGYISDLGELAPFLAPAEATIEAAIEIAVLRARKDEVGVGLVCPQCPEAGVGLNREGCRHP